MQPPETLALLESHGWSSTAPMSPRASEPEKATGRGQPK